MSNVRMQTRDPDPPIPPIKDEPKTGLDISALGPEPEPSDPIRPQSFTIEIRIAVAAS